MKFLWPCPGSEMRSRSKWKVSCTPTMIVRLIGIKYVQICEAVWAESCTQVPHVSYIEYAEKLSFLWPCPGSEMRSMSKLKVCCTSTMIVQLIGTKYVQICEAVWEKYHPYSGQTDTRTHRRTWIRCPPSGHSPRAGQKVNKCQD